ncbi:FliM/FliN family flagellar motor switch protein [Leptospira sp. 2 VSF19]|uniref:FliM/FliN family flagellar motor switch protein n=1 Tax=Leptospira soteropolitanensis TaxID=2950025 RepID=A0AAW5VCI0_9LEPT|nr:FliM/FliN family flagellar motor switch protein [Leptospira soteropolitanensis]MCW7492571.1 FliM/FliN family flagellar motor switch protein [Leptospira soteropolitanensis]MCW7500619.1 FliM/FliN family flagellar motor switch protein [Leptospira soteropolitanensis]MCW7522711.1 FliM/FliN family flagellar motor switch protein [Leptospira soteropolitanensis]MCW7526567.1 FliM/FliN family flagellar motor switch protein [Leptospira soteropolitanensis]MCW7530589.1 FliM/FliN family flagellar motor sw
MQQIKEEISQLENSNNKNLETILEKLKYFLWVKGCFETRKNKKYLREFLSTLSYDEIRNAFGELSAKSDIKTLLLSYLKFYLLSHEFEFSKYFQLMESKLTNLPVPLKNCFLEETLDQKKNGILMIGKTIACRTVFKSKQNRLKLKKFELNRHELRTSILDSEVNLVAELNRGYFTEAEIMSLANGSIVKFDNLQNCSIALYAEASDLRLFEGSIIIADENFGIKIEKINDLRDSNVIRSSSDRIRGRLILGERIMTCREILKLELNSNIKLNTYPGEPFILKFDNGISFFGYAFLRNSNIAFQVRGRVDAIGFVDTDNESGGEDLNVLQWVSIFKSLFNGININTYYSKILNLFSFENQRSDKFNLLIANKNLKDIDPKEILNYIQEENNQFFALVLKFIDSEQSLAILSNLEATVRMDVESRIAKINISKKRFFANIERFILIRSYFESTKTFQSSIQPMEMLFVLFSRSMQEKILIALEKEGSSEIANELRRVSE